MIEVIKLFMMGVDIFFVIYLIGYSSFLFLSVLFGSMEMHEKRLGERLKNTLHHEFYIPISIVVPAYNEQTTIVDTVKTLLLQAYPLFEIIVVDDGSGDETTQRMVEAFAMTQVDRPVHRLISCKQAQAIYETRVGKVAITLVQKENGGKADALNMGINVSQFPYYICMDADSMLQKNSLYEIAKPVLEDDRVVACGGQVAVSNNIKLVDGEVKDYHLPKNLLVSMQVLEYERSFLASRVFMNRFNGNLIISGAFGLFKKSAVLLVGGYDNTTMGEDMELVVKLHEFHRANNIDYSIQYAPDAVCWSQAPGTLPDLARQRRRWHIGLFESLRKYTSVVGRLRYGIMGTISFLYYWIYELLSPYIEIFGLFTILLSFAVNLINVPFMLMFFLIYSLFGCVLTLTSFFTRLYLNKMHFSFKDVCKAILLCGFELVGLRFILMVVRLFALIGYRKNRTVWGEHTRYEHHRK